MEEDVRKINHSDFLKLSNDFNKIKFFLRYAVLAPSTHNSQPWLFKISGSICQVFYNEKLILSEVDPLRRDLYISLGAAIENINIAARYFGILQDIKYINTGNLVAEISFDFSASIVNIKYKKLLDAVLIRKNVRGKFGPGAVDKGILDDIIRDCEQEYFGSDGNIHFIADKDKIEALAKLTAQGMKMAHARKKFRQEMSRWINSNYSKRKEGIPGYTMEMPNLLSLIIPKLISFVNMGKVLGLKNYLSLRTAPVVTVLSTKDSNIDSWLKVGRLAERIFLEFTSRNIKSSIFVASIEMGELNQEVKKIIGTDNKPQFLFVSGYKEEAQKYALRHEVEEKLI